MVFNTGEYTVEYEIYEETGVDGLRDGRVRTQPYEEMTDMENLQAENRLFKAQLRDKEAEMLLLKKSGTGMGWSLTGVRQENTNTAIK